jgi:hypothetical protein
MRLKRRFFSGSALLELDTPLLKCYPADSPATAFVQNAYTSGKQAAYPAALMKSQVPDLSSCWKPLSGSGAGAHVLAERGKASKDFLRNSKICNELQLE